MVGYAGGGERGRGDGLCPADHQFPAFGSPGLLIGKVLFPQTNNHDKAFSKTWKKYISILPFVFDDKEIYVKIKGHKSNL